MRTFVGCVLGLVALVGISRPTAQVPADKFFSASGVRIRHIDKDQNDWHTRAHRRKPGRRVDQMKRLQQLLPSMRLEIIEGRTHVSAPRDPHFIQAIRSHIVEHEKH